MSVTGNNRRCGNNVVALAKRLTYRESAMLLIDAPRNPGQLVVVPDRLWTRLRTHLRGASLDEQLADGTPAEANRVLASRAQHLVSASARLRLARDWEHLTDVAHQPPVGRNARASLCRRRIALAEPELREMLDVLVSELPTTARGVAMASVLLRDGSGPLFNRRCDHDLGVALGQVTGALDPFAALVS
jgi:hypothetical protein